MKHLIIFSHLNPKSFTKAIVTEVAAVAKDNGHDVRMIDLYGEGFNPILGMPDVAHQFMGNEIPDDVRRYQELITWADHLTVIYPMWWGQMPAILKGFIDRVFTHGFAYRVTPTGTVGLLKGRTAQVFINTGTENTIYRESKMHEAQIRVINKAVFEYVGFKTNTTFFGHVSRGTDELRKGYLEEIRTLY